MVANDAAFQQIAIMPLSRRKIEAALSELCVDRQADKDASAGGRGLTLEVAIRAVDYKLAGVYPAIQEDAVEIDNQLKARMAGPKVACDHVQTSLPRLAAQAASYSQTPVQIAALEQMLRQNIETADIQARSAYLNAVISKIRLSDDNIQIFMDKAILATVIAGQHVTIEMVSSLIRKQYAKAAVVAILLGRKPATRVDSSTSDCSLVF